MANYFDNEAVEVLIKEYLSYALEERTIHHRPVFLREEILKEVSKIINGIIFTHKFTVWENYDDLFQEAAMACIKALDRFDPEFITASGQKATAFNYFSLTSKRCLKFYTIRNKKNRENQPIEDHEHQLFVNEDFTETSNSVVVESFISSLRRIFDEKKYKKFMRLVDILEEYLIKMGSYNKRDFFRFGKSFGWSPNLIRKFLKIIKDNKDMIEGTVSLD